ncbi:PucR family transcriptional regulator ligand-binding domain-containing protein [Paenibacillus methanolicus]|uniref:Purine catabolism regulator n=1 Tax=Paenibacillus methanolicus TaxID=582686 RepID=A0A5S5C7T1_9BACL|nr:PucR family transcriptional regulator ligand-binding domain-containing protein [Paenibacillus methanolicus]TYP75465.1 purine catabolism regulator [Paenibacillus methanolicus]
METERSLTVGEALKRPLFEGARLAAGAAGLHRRIRWVHILEITNFETLIHGEEMILTTGMGFAEKADSPLAFMRGLIGRKAACLCIELGPKFPEAPRELMELADRHAFPLIVFPRTVRYVDITQDLHSAIINRHHLMLQELERLSRAFHRLTLASQGTLNVLKLLHQSTGAQLVYRPLAGKPTCFPPLRPDEQAPLLEQTAARAAETETVKPDVAPLVEERDGQYRVLKPIGALDQTWASLLMICPRQPGEFEYLLLDSAALSIAQELLRTRYMEERKLFAENRWIAELLGGELRDEKQLRVLVGLDYKKLSESRFQVCLIEIDNLYDETLGMNEQEWESIRLHLSLLLRSAFERHAFRPLMTMKNNRLVMLAFDLKSKLPSKIRLRQALDALGDLHADEKLKDLKLVAGIGGACEQLALASHSYQEAAQALALHATCKQPIVFYDELGVFQLLLRLNDGSMLQQFVRSNLGPLIDHDQSKGSELLHTLKVYLDHDGSKQLAAQRLFIVRQSLYYRLDKIAELLGEHYMAPENRIAIQVALRAYQMLYPDKLRPVTAPAAERKAARG